MQQKLTQQFNDIKNLPAIVKTHLGFDAALRGTLRTQRFNQLITELEKHLGQLNFESNDPKEKEKIEAFAAFMACTHKYYKDLERILNVNQESIPPSSFSSSSASINPLKTSENVLAASKEYLRALDVFSRDFNRGAYLGNVALHSLGTGLALYVMLSLPFYTLTFFLSLAVGLPLAMMPPTLFALLLAGPVIFFLEGAVAQAASFPIRHARGLLPTEVKLTNMFGFFQEAGNITSSFAWAMHEESKGISEFLKVSSAP